MPLPGPLLDPQARGLLMLREAIRAVAGEGVGGAHAAGRGGASSGGVGGVSGGGHGAGTADRPGGPVAGDGESEAMVHLVRLAQGGRADAFGGLCRIYWRTVFRCIDFPVPTRAPARDL